jgi:hypothetical protein
MRKHFSGFLFAHDTLTFQSYYTLSLTRRVQQFHGSDCESFIRSPKIRTHTTWVYDSLLWTIRQEIWTIVNLPSEDATAY